MAILSYLGGLSNRGKPSTIRLSRQRRIVVFMATPVESSFGPRRFLQDPAPGATILVVEDPFVTGFLCAVLQRYGHRVMTADAVRASDLIRDHSVGAQVVITNRPEVFLPFAGTLPILYIASNPDPAIALQFATCRVLRKPFLGGALLEAVEQLAHSAVP
jgi:hypothetical protein